MDAFVTRTGSTTATTATRSSKKRKSSPEVSPDGEAAQDEPTDVKLVVLSSLHPAVDQEALLDLLLAHDGDVEATCRTLKTSPRSHVPKKSGTGSAVAAQSSLLRAFAVTSPGSDAPTPSSSKRSKRSKLLSRKGATLHLYDPEDIREHTPCTIIHNFLPAEEANSLLLELLKESESFEKITFKLFDNVVSSPHTSGFYVGSHKELQEQKREYVYNGSRMTVS